MNKVKVGPITMALGLIITGTILFLGNFVDDRLLLNAWKLWPLLLVGLGLEFLIRDAMRKRAAEPVEVKFSWASMMLIGFIIFAGFTAHVTYKIAGEANIDQLIREQVFHDAVTYTRPFEKEPIAVTGKNIRLTIDNNRGDISIRSSNDKKVYVRGEIVTDGPSEEEAREKATKVKVNIEGTENILVKANLPDYRGPNQGAAVNYEILVPKDINVEIKNKMGEVVASGLDGKIKVLNKMGTITVSDIKGIIDVESDLGEIKIERVLGDIKAHSKTGAISILEPEAGVDVTTELGSIEFSSAKILNGRYALNAQSGSINISIPENSDLKVYAVSDHGSVEGPKALLRETDDRNGTMPKNKIQGNLGEGKGELKASSNNGSITLNLR